MFIQETSVGWQGSSFSCIHSSSPYPTSKQGHNYPRSPLIFNLSSNCKLYLKNTKALRLSSSNLFLGVDTLHRTACEGQTQIASF